MKKAILYIHGKGGNPQEGSQYVEHCPGLDVIGVDFDGYLPWAVRPQIQASYEEARRSYRQIWILANSIGAYFAMDALQREKIEKALFISPVLDMERLILDMMKWAGVSEEELRDRGEIPTDFGETLSWEYLCFVRENPIQWTIPTEILYGAKDHLTTRQTVEAFVSGHRTALTVMEDGEHWFHTDGQLAFLKDWIRRVLL